jgi:Ni2+-binding GTPase involved in maturation of urease and hydrogenase
MGEVPLEEADTSLASTSPAADAGPVDPTRILNVNVGVLGHVDSGKTSLVKALSTLLSTAGACRDVSR